MTLKGIAGELRLGSWIYLPNNPTKTNSRARTR